jgi:NAD(P)H dehydrogenase (quinone)
MLQSTAAIVKKTPPVTAVVGAAGISGTHLLGTLRSAGVITRAVVHSDAGAKRAFAAGADETVQVELADPASVQAALQGVNAVYMIPPSFDPDEHLFAITALRAAEQVGATRFVYVSVLHPHTPGLRHHMRKAQAEAALRESSLVWTILQPSMYAQVAWLTVGSAPAGPVRIPFDTASTFSVIDLRDLSKVAVKILTEQGHEFATYELCGPQLTMAEIVRIAGRVRGVGLDPVSVTPSEAPMPPRFAKSASMAADLRAMWEEYDRHGLRGNSNVLRMLLGRDPATFDEVARSTIAKA